MRFSAKQLVTTSIIIGLAFLPSCGGDIHEAKVSNTIPKMVPRKIQEGVSPAALAASKAKATKKHKAEVYLWMTLVHNNAVKAYNDAYEKFLKSQKPSVTLIPPASLSSHGPHSDAWWHGVAICEQGGRNDPYFGYFSYMDGSAGGKTWSEQVIMGNATIAKYGEDMMYGGAWAHKCVMAGYAASPSG